MKELYYAESIAEKENRVIMVDYETEQAAVVACGVCENEMLKIISEFDKNGKTLNVVRKGGKMFKDSRDAFKGLVGIQLLRYRVHRFK